MKTIQKTCLLAVLTGMAFLTLPAVAQQGQGQGLRLRTGLESVLSHQEVIVRVAEINPRSPAARVAVTFFDRNGRRLDRRVGEVSATRVFETTMRASAIGNQPRELVRIDVKIFGVTDASLPSVHVDVHDPFGLSIEERLVCGPGAQSRGVEALCEGFVATDFTFDP